MELSSQAKWYLGGQWPVYKKNHTNPEPKAMEELVTKGYAKYEAGYLITAWTLTKKGQEAREELRKGQ